MQIFLVETHWTDPRHKTIIHSHLLWLEHPIWMKTYHYRVKDLSKCLIRLTIKSMAHHYKAYCHKHLNYSTPLNRIIFNNISQVLGNHRDCVTQAHPNDCDHIHNFWVEQPSFFMCGDIYRCRMTKRNADSFFRLLLIIWYTV